MRYAWMAIVAAVAAGSVGCTSQMQMPGDFVSVDRENLGQYHQRAISADGVVIGLRTQDSPSDGTLAFWSQALKDELATSQGYQFVKSEDIRSGAGEGKLMEFKADQRGVVAYLLAVYMKPRQVVMVEAGGKMETVAKHRDAVVESMKSVR